MRAKKELLRVGESTGLHHIAWIALLPTTAYFCYYLNLAAFIMILVLVIISTVLTKFMHLQLTPSLYVIILHVVFHFGILALVLYVGDLIDKWSILFSLVFYVSAFVMTVGSYCEPSDQVDQ